MAGLGAGRREGRLSAGPSAYLSAEWGEALLGGTESCRGEVEREREPGGLGGRGGRHPSRGARTFQG